MSQFKVGQRVRVIGYRFDPNTMGREATIIGPLEFVENPGPDIRSYWGHCVDIDGYGSRSIHGRRLCSPVEWLAPLTDPHADAFMERLKKLGREPVNSPEKVTV